QPGDARDLLQRFAEFGGPIVLDALCKARDDRGAIESLDRDDEGKSKFRVVRAIELVKPRELLRRALRQAGARLLLARVRRELAAHRCLSRELRMGTDKSELPLLARARHGLDHRPMQFFDARKGTLRQCRLGDPRRMLEDPAKRGDEAGGVDGVELVERHSAIGVRSRPARAASIRREASDSSRTCAGSPRMYVAAIARSSPSIMNANNCSARVSVREKRRANSGVASGSSTMKSASCPGARLPRRRSRPSARAAPSV